MKSLIWLYAGALGLLLAVSAGFYAYAAPPPPGSPQDLMTAPYGEQRTKFFQHYVTSYGGSCCSPAEGTGDCRLTAVRAHEGALRDENDSGMDVWFGRDNNGAGYPGGNDTWVEVPKQALLAHSPQPDGTDMQNPFGRTIACIMPGDWRPDIEGGESKQHPRVLCLTPATGF